MFCLSPKKYFRFENQIILRCWKIYSTKLKMYKKCGLEDLTMKIYYAVILR